MRSRAAPLAAPRVAWVRTPVMELESQIGEFGRGERASASLTQQSLRFVMINRTRRESLPVAAARGA